MNLRPIAFDFDDVVAGFNRAFITHTNRHHGYNLCYEDITTFDMCQLYGVDQETIVSRVRHFCHHHHDEIVPYDGTREALEILSKEFELHIVTSRCESLRDITTNWLKAHSLEYFSELHFTNGFGSRYPERKRTKAAVCQEIGAQLLIEDAPENAQSVSGSGVPVLIPNHPWNQDVTGNLIVRAHSWQEAVHWIETNL